MKRMAVNPWEWPKQYQFNGCNSHTDTDHRQLRIGTTLSRAVTSAL